MGDRIKTQIAIIGAGPAGLFLSLALKSRGITSVVLEKHTRDHVEGRVRAGVLERGTVAFMEELGLAARLHRECLRHTGVNLAVDGEVFRIDFERHTSASAVTIYGQAEVMKDLFAAASHAQIEIIFEAEDVNVEDVTFAPSLTFTSAGQRRTVDAQFIVGCDGWHGISRNLIPPHARNIIERTYDFGWLGLLAQAPPCASEIIYANHHRGFALASMRSTTRSRYYVQCKQPASLKEWSDDRIWDELSQRLGTSLAAKLTRGPTLEKSFTPLRSAVCEPMNFGRLFLAGDAAHILPPTGAKGLNLAVHDVKLLAQAFADYFATDSSTRLNTYSKRALTRAWQAARFSWWLTELMHHFPDRDEFTRKVWRAELDRLRFSQTAQKNFAENYVGL